MDKLLSRIQSAVPLNVNMDAARTSEADVLISLFKDIEREMRFFIDGVYYTHGIKLISVADSFVLASLVQLNNNSELTSEVGFKRKESSIITNCLHRAIITYKSSRLKDSDWEEWIDGLDSNDKQELRKLRNFYSKDLMDISPDLRKLTGEILSMVRKIVNSKTVKSLMFILDSKIDVSSEIYKNAIYTKLIVANEEDIDLLQNVLDGTIRDYDKIKRVCHNIFDGVFGDDDLHDMIVSELINYVRD